jgi:broad specificity phosphatase PhoE
MPAQKIMVIRHAEKALPGEAISGVRETGVPDPNSLSVRGWQRAGALALLLAPQLIQSPASFLETPTAIFATAVTQSKLSLRPQQTVKPLAEKLGIDINKHYGDGDEALLVAAAQDAGEVVLISWRREKLPAIAEKILGQGVTVPRHWPEERFDLIWVFLKSQDQWRLEQVPQMLLAGDSIQRIPI